MRQNSDRLYVNGGEPFNEWRDKVTAYLVTFDTGDRGSEDSKFFGVIQKYSWAKLNKKAFVLYADIKIEQIYRELNFAAGEQESFYVFPLQGVWGGRGDEEVGEWLDDHLDFAFPACAGTEGA